MSTDLKYIRTNRNEKDFYALMGKFFGSRQVAKDLGMPMWDDPNREWLLCLDNDRPVACGSIEIKGENAVMKSGWVEEGYRGKGVYNTLFELRMQLAKDSGVKIMRATVTEKSKNTFIRQGFRNNGMRGKYYMMKKELNEDV